MEVGRSGQYACVWVCRAGVTHLRVATLLAATCWGERWSQLQVKGHSPLGGRAKNGEGARAQNRPGEHILRQARPPRDSHPRARAPPRPAAPPAAPKPNWLLPR